uniref:Transposase n=1 Tax=Acrobeloides nanus TaxID=290746 RepID=A0A914CKD2_9BILA
MVVEIDECFITPRKGRRGRRMRRLNWWLFEATERSSNSSFLELYRRRTVAVPITMVRRHIHSGTTIMIFFYRHFVINHIHNLVNPVNRRIHTQTIESKWQKWRANVR